MSALTNDGAGEWRSEEHIRRNEHLRAWCAKMADVPACHVFNVREEDDRISFDVERPVAGTP